jgi:hypothetical protein
MHADRIALAKLKDEGKVKTVKMIRNDTCSMQHFGWLYTYAARLHLYDCVYNIRRFLTETLTPVATSCTTLEN